MSHPINSNNEMGDLGGHEFDPQVNFSQFLEEAREHAAFEGNVSVPRPSSYPEKAAEGSPKRSKKSWKKALFSWLRVDRKSRRGMNPASASSSSTAIRSGRRQGYASGPVFGSGGEVIRQRPRHQNLETRSGLLSPKRPHKDVPYMCLDRQQLAPRGSQAYGPLYMVT